jgi:hypothetical protein
MIMAGNTSFSALALYWPSLGLNAPLYFTLSHRLRRSSTWSSDYRESEVIGMSSHLTSRDPSQSVYSARFPGTDGCLHFGSSEDTGFSTCRRMPTHAQESQRHVALKAPVSQAGQISELVYRILSYLQRGRNNNLAGTCSSDTTVTG